MTDRDRYPAGVPCWVDTLQPDPAAALDFYGPLFGWEFAGPGPMSGGLPGEYFVALVDGREVAGIGTLPDVGGPPAPAWATYVGVERIEVSIARAEDAGGTLIAGPLDAPPAGRVGVVADPAGAVICLWEAQARQGAQRVNEPGTWMMSSLHTPDPTGAAAFYGAVFGWEPEPYGPAEAHLALLRLPGYVGGEAAQPIPRDVVAAMTPTGGDGTVPPHWNVNLRVDDADLTTSRAVTLGGSVLMPPQDTPGFRSAVLADAQGAVFSISQVTAGG